MQDELSKVKIIKCDIYIVSGGVTITYLKIVIRNVHVIFIRPSLCTLTRYLSPVHFALWHAKKENVKKKKRQDVTKDRIKKQVAESLKKLYKL